MATDASFPNARDLNARDRDGPRRQQGHVRRPAAGAALRQSRIATGAANRAGDFRRARFHTLLVKFLRLVCPLLAVIGIGYYALIANLSSSAGKLQVRVGAIEISTKDLKMVNPHMEGQTSNGGRFTVTAKSATQDLANTDLIKLADIDGKMQQPDLSTMNLTAPTGSYSSKAQLLTLKGPISIKGSDGLVGHLKSARVLLKEQYLSSKDPVTIEMTTGRIQSQRFNLNPKQKRAFFAGKVHVHLKPEEKPVADGVAGSLAATAAVAPSPLAGAQNGPVDVRSDRLTLFDAHKRAYFRGNANAIQGDFTLKAPQLLVRYEGNATPGGTAEPTSGAQGTSNQSPNAQSSNAQSPNAKSGGAQLRQIEASGGVVVTTKDGRVLKGQTALFDNAANTMLVDGQVLLVQEGSELTGSRLTADMTGRVMHLAGAPRVTAKMRPAASTKPGAAGKKTTSAKKPASASAPEVASLATGLVDFSADAKEPMNVTADSLDVYDAKRLAIFKGRVAVDRGEHHLRSDRLEIEYMGDALAAPATSTPAGNANLSGQVRTVTARGSVLLTSKDQTVTGDEAVFDVQTDRATVEGNVVVTQGKNVLKGAKLVIDMKTGQTFFDTGSAAPGVSSGGKACPAGRICAVFVPSQTKRGAGKKGAAANPPAAGEQPTGIQPPQSSSSWSTRTNLGGYDLRHRPQSE